VRKAPLIIALAAAGCGRFDFHEIPIDAAVDAVPDAPPDAAACGAGYALQSSTEPSLSRYRLGTATDWLTAEHACEADGTGAHLIILDESLEMNALEAFFNNADTQVWIGYSDLVVDGTFKFVTSDMTAFLPGWSGGNSMPSHPGPGCVAFDPASRQITDGPCEVALAYACECDGIAVVPANY
jgi:hypothetical protein